MSNDFKEVLQRIVNMPFEDKIGLALTAIKNLAPELTKRFDKDKATILILTIFSTSVAADGKLTKEEFVLVKAFLSAAGAEIPDEKLVEMLADLSGNDAYTAINALSKGLSVDGQANLVSLVAAVCAIDDRINPSEVAFLSDIYNA